MTFAEQKAAADRAFQEALRKLDQIQLGVYQHNPAPGIQSVGYWSAQGHWFTNY